MRTDTDSCLRFVPIEKATEPIGGLCEIIKDAWWCVHPDKGLIFFALNERHGAGTPQCNTNERLARDLCAKLYPWAEVRHIPLVFREADP